MTKPRKLTSEQEMAYHLEGIAAGCRDGNAYSIAEARRMLASKVLLVALEMARGHVEFVADAECGSEEGASARQDLTQIDAAIAKATGDKP